MSVMTNQSRQTHHADVSARVLAIREPVQLVRTPEGAILPMETAQGEPHAVLPPLYPEWLGDRGFNAVHGVRFPYVSGAMANGIATTAIVIEMARHGMLGFFGAAGLSYARVKEAIDELTGTLDPQGLAWGSNLIHSPNEPALEESVVGLYLERGVRRVSASAYMTLSPHIVWYAAKGLCAGPAGHVQRQNYVFAKISRPEVARHFMSPPPQAMLDALVSAGKLTSEEARLASQLPVAEDIIVEADSGGHTDNQALPALFPMICSLRDELTQAHGYYRPIRIGAAGGLGCPSAVAAAFGMGAAFVLTGSVNQGAVESGLDESGRVLLAQAGLADVIMAAAADMFELGVKLQVLKRGTMFGVRANRLYEVYREYPSIDAIPQDVRTSLEKQIFRMSLAEVWEETAAFWGRREPAELEKATSDPKHKMALCFRWYLGLSSRWAIAGQADRKMDYQIWCGPAMGAFNDWVRGSVLDAPESRTVGQIALNLLEGAAVVTRAQQLRSYGVPVPAAAFQYTPQILAVDGRAVR
ncbi:MAG: PfaD family polyunsaturated fatty acid/polyketide biosynthesis protein [Myxococcota bacterium]|nr:PfaD family polyunsaturated fatty acid/polyketide biosynthesis protein [Myxococcota bacterium]